MKLFASLKTKFVIWVWNHTPNCAEMSRLTSRALDESLPLKLRLQIKLHHLICVWCKRYFQQLHFLRDAAPRLEMQPPTLSPQSLSVEAKQRMAQRILAATNHSSVRTGG